MSCFTSNIIRQLLAHSLAGSNSQSSINGLERTASAFIRDSVKEPVYECVRAVFDQAGVVNPILRGA
ncbi:MAG: hypothetical protein HYR70_10980 [Chloroflexi bacterium]|nr:hypothetical protein [Chloroflexota bacterium]MBI3340062.1 hypothetical protein [Chloroflexota bacterium]